MFFKFVLGYKKENVKENERLAQCVWQAVFSAAPSDQSDVHLHFQADERDEGQRSSSNNEPV